FLQLFKSEILKNVKSNLIVYTEIEMIKLQINDQMFTVQNTHYSDDLAHNLIFYKSLKQQNFKIKNIEENELDIFKITDSDKEILFFSETKYFLLITDDTTRKH